MFNRILVVCTGNICRSPMAEALLADRLRKAGRPALVASAGIAALIGHPADPAALALMLERGIDISGHRARQLSAELIRSFELILVMEAGQQRVIEVHHPVARGRVHRLGRFGGFDIPDPFRQGTDAFQRSLAMIERGISGFAGILRIDK